MFLHNIYVYQLQIQIVVILKMNWDCTMFMRTSLDEKLPIHLKLSGKKTNSETENVQNLLMENKKPQKKNKQNDKSREIKKKMSLKSKSSSMNKKYEHEQDFKENLANEADNFYDKNCQLYQNKSKKQSRLRTETTYSNTTNAYIDSIPLSKGNSTQRHLQYIPQSLNSPCFRTVIKKSISLNQTHQSHQNLCQVPLKITPFCELLTTRTGDYGNKTIPAVNQFKKIHPVIKINNNQVRRDHEERTKLALSFKNTVFLNGKEIEYGNSEKEHLRNNNIQEVQNHLEVQKVQKNSEQVQKQAKKQKIEDFLNSKTITKSVRDSGDLSELSECSRVVITYQEILKEHGKFQLDG